MRGIFIFGLLLLASVAVWKVGIPLYKRRALARAWMPILQTGGAKITEDELVKELKKVDDREVDTLIDFSKLMEKQDWKGVGKIFSQVLTILKKTKINLQYLIKGK